MAWRARSRLRRSSACASAKRTTTVAASIHSPMSAAPTTATVISTNMSRRPCRADAMARRSVVAPPAATASARSATHHGRGAPSASAAEAARQGAGADRQPRHPRAGRRRPHVARFVVGEGAQPGFGDRLGNRAARRHRGVVGDEQALPHHVGRGALDAAQGAEPARQQLGLVLAAQPLDAEGRFRVVDADGALSGAGHVASGVTKRLDDRVIDCRVMAGPLRCGGGPDRAACGCARRRAGSRPDGRRGGRGRCAGCAAVVTDARRPIPTARRPRTDRRRTARRAPAHRRGGPASDRRGRRTSPPALRRRARRGAGRSRRGERPGRDAWSRLDETVII